MKNIFKATFVIIGTIIGAGFATGQEIYLFFGKAGQLGIVMLLFSCAISGIIIYKTMDLINKNKIKTYRAFLEVLLKRKTGILINSIQLIVTWFLAICFIVMCSGSRRILFPGIGPAKAIRLCCNVLFMRTNIYKKN